MTFHDAALSKVLRKRVVESRLHMDGAERVAPDLFQAHRRLQRELTGVITTPVYAILDPTTGEFLYRMQLRSGDLAVWLKDFKRLFELLPEKPGAASAKAGD